MDRSPHNRWAGWLPYLCLSVAGLLGGTAAAAEDRVYPCNKLDFRIPYRIENNGQGLIGLYLYVSRDQGKTYEYVAPPASPATPPANQFFVYHAPQDGEYWFIVQTRDAAGVHPVDPRYAQPQLKVHVDRQPPRIVLFRQAQPHDGSRAAVEWLIEDESFASAALEYRAQGTNDTWYPVPEAAQSARATQSFSPVIAGPLDVRLRVQDKGGNVAEQVASVTPAAGPVAANPGAPPGPPQEGTGPEVKYVNSRTFQLNFELNPGPSGIDHIDVWTLRNGTWTKAPGDPIKKLAGPYTFTVQSGGRWGFTLVPTSGVGISAPAPKAGDLPQLWVEVDETRPVVRLPAPPSVTPGAEGGTLTVTWSASDTFMRRESIAIAYSEKREGPWTPLPNAERLANTGTFRTTTQGLPHQIYIQVRAVDEGGNEGVAVTEQPVKIDLTVPSIKFLTIGGPAQAIPPAPGIGPRSSTYGEP